MDRRRFLQVAASPALHATTPTPDYRVVTRYSETYAGMPGSYRGAVTRVHSEAVIDTRTERVDRAVSDKMLSEGMRKLTGAKDDGDAWRSFFSPSDVIGIKVN